MKRRASSFRAAASVLAVAIAVSLLVQPEAAKAQQKITINYPNRSGSNWPIFLAKDGGYYQKYGLDVTLTFGVMPTGIAMLASGEAQMVNSSLEQLMQAASKDGSMVLDRERAEPRRVRADGEEGDRLDQGFEGEEDRGEPGGRRAVWVPGGSAVEIRCERARYPMDSGGNGCERTGGGADQRAGGRDAVDGSGVLQGGRGGI